MMNLTCDKAVAAQRAAAFCAVAALLALALLRVSDTWSAAESALATAAIAIAAVAAISALVFRARIRVTAADIVLSVWWLYVMGRAWVDPACPAASALLKSSLLLSLYLSLRVVLSQARLPGSLIAAGFAAAAVIEGLIGISQLIAGHSHHWRYAVTGAFFNPGPYGVMLALGLVMLVALRREQGQAIKARHYGRWAEWIFSALLFIILLPLGASGSRAAWVGAALGLLIIYRREALKQWKWLVPAGLLLAVAFYLFKQGSADGRMLIWRISAINISDHPLAGAGIGSFFQQYSAGMERLAAAMPDGEPVCAGALDYAMNFFLLIGVEQGAIGLSLALGAAAIMICISFRSRSAIGLVMPVLIVTSLFSYTFELLPFQIITVVSAAWLVSSTDRKTAHEKRLLPAVAALSALALAAAVFSPVRNRADAMGRYESIRGVHHRSFIPAYYELLPMMTDNRRFLFDMGKTLREAGRYNDSNDMLRRGELISNDPMFAVLQGNNYADLGETDRAEQAYLRAYGMMPNRLYPLYRLMLLYQGAGRDDEARTMAARIIDFPEKISSPATRDMKQKARELAAGHPDGDGSAEGE